MGSREPGQSTEPQAELLHILSGIATRFLGLASHEVDEAVCTAIGELGEHLGADRTHVLVLQPESRLGDVTHQW